MWWQESDKRDIYIDTRDHAAGPSADDDMSTWDEAKLQAVVDAKKGGQGERCKTDIICKHFLDAVRRSGGSHAQCPRHRPTASHPPVPSPQSPVCRRH